MIKKLTNLKTILSFRGIEGLIVAVFLIFFSRNIILPSFNINRQINSELIQVQERLSRIKNYVSAVDKDRKKSLLLNKNYEAMEIAEALSEVQKLAQDNGIKIENVRLKDLHEVSSKGIDYSASPIELGVGGTESALIGFATGLEQCKFLNRLAHVSISVDPQNEDKIKAQIRLEKIDIRKFSQPDMTESLVYHSEPSILKAKGAKLFRLPQEMKSKNVLIPLEGRTDVLKDLNLVGIVDDGGRKAVIEDQKTSKTYFLNVGDLISEMKVIEIKDSEVVLEAQGAHYNLLM